MKKTTKNNSGFTLIELVIAMAILAFLMTAVSSFMGSGVLNLRKTKADIDVHGSAQDVYDQISDSIMSAKNFIVCAYVIDGTIDGTTATSTDATFLTAGDVSDQSMVGPYYFVRDDAQKKELTTGRMSKYLCSYEDIMTYEELPAGVRLYVKQIIVDKPVEIDPAYSTELYDWVFPKEVTNALTGKKVKIDMQLRNDDKLSTKTDPVPSYAQSKDGRAVFTEKDIERSVITFDENVMYLQREYAYMDKLNDYYTGSYPTSEKKSCKYSESLNYLKLEDSDTAPTVSGCILRIDEAKKAFYLELYFMDKNTTYTTSSMISTRNTYVLKTKK